MKEENLIKLKELIVKEIKLTKASIKEYSKHTQPISPENAIGRISRMDAINNKSVMEAALRKAEEKLDNLYSVKEKINNKDFGQCVNCGKEIPFGRLLLMPHSQNCVNCAQ